MQKITNNVLELVKRNIPEDAGVDLNKFSPDSKLIEELGYDSIRMMGLFFSIEQEFEIDIINSCDNYKFFSIETVNDLIDLLQDYNN